MTINLLDSLPGQHMCMSTTEQEDRNTWCRQTACGCWLAILLAFWVLFPIHCSATRGLHI